MPSRADLCRIVDWLALQPGGLLASRFVRLLAYSGMRWGEACELRWCDVSFESHSLVIGRDGNTKSGRARVLPLFACLEAVLREIYSHEVAAEIVPHSDSPHAKHFPPASALVTGVVDLRYWLGLACAALSLPRLRSHHVWRKYFVTQALNAGVDVPTVSKYVGHADGGNLIFRTYNVLSDNRLTEGAAKVNLASAVLT